MALGCKFIASRAAQLDQLLKQLRMLDHLAAQLLPILPAASLNDVVHRSEG